LRCSHKSWRSQTPFGAQLCGVWGAHLGVSGAVTGVSGASLRVCDALLRVCGAVKLHLMRFDAILSIGAVGVEPKKEGPGSTHKKKHLCYAQVLLFSVGPAGLEPATP